jgi:hypothetical protein
MKTLTLCALVSILACTHQEPKPTTVSAPVPSNGKMVAPIVIEAQLFEKRAKVTLTFATGGENVAVGVSGVDGLSVTSTGSLMTEGVVSKGESRSFEVAFSPGPGRSHLVVSATGTFNGAPISRVVTFQIGDGPRPSTGTKVVTDDGTAIKVMKQP